MSMEKQRWERDNISSREDQGFGNHQEGVAADRNHRNVATTAE
jgi:hypothetical protein